MEARRRMVSAAVLVVIGAISISRFSAGVRNVAIVGLVGGGFALGVALGLFIMARAGNAS
jgi:hypothetical protein